MKKAIYTCIIGTYDELVQPLVLDNGFDYILFVKKGTKTTDRKGVWQVRELDYDCADNTIASRYPKMNPHRVLPEYDYSLWMDGNLVIRSVDFYESVNRRIALGIPYSGVKHILRDCVYRDIEACVHAHRDSFGNIFRALNFLIRERFPQHFGMYENNVILRSHHDTRVTLCDETWWDLYLRYPRRDQFTGPYCLRKADLPFDYLLPEGESAKTSPWIDYLEHRVPRPSFLRYGYEYLACRVRTYAILAYMRIRGVNGW